MDIVTYRTDFESETLVIIFLNFHVPLLERIIGLPQFELVFKQLLLPHFIGNVLILWIVYFFFVAA
jgi:hypothetical protein